MTQIDWRLQDPNAFARGYQQTSGIIGGVVDSFKQGAQDNALRQYAMNPNDPNSVNALAQHGDPRMAIAIRERQAAAQREKQERDTQIIATLARDAKDPQSFDAAVDQVVAMGYPDAVQFKGKFSPALRSALMAAGGIKDEQGQGERIIPLQQGGSALAYDPVTRQTRTLIAPNPGGQQTGAPVAQGGGPQPGTIEEGYRFKGGDPARPENWEPVEGGPTPQASGTFRP